MVSSFPCLFLFFLSSFLACSDGVLLSGSPWPWWRGDAGCSGRSNYSLANVQTPYANWKYATNNFIVATPVIHNRTVYVCSLDGAAYALDEYTGALKWKFQTRSVIETSATAGPDGSVYFGSSDGCVYGVNSPLATILYAATQSAVGALLWKSGGCNALQLPGYSQQMPLLSADGSMVFATSTDALLYAYSAASGGGVWHFQTGNEIIGSPALDNNGTIYVASKDMQIYALSSATGALWWSYATSAQIQSSPALSPLQDVVYIGNDNGTLYALYTSSGAKKWLASPVTGVMLSSPAVAADGTVYVCGFNVYQVVALNPGDGSIKWTYTTNGGMKASPIIAGDGRIYVGDISNRINCITDAGVVCGGGWPYRVATNSIYSSAAIDPDGTLFVASSDYRLYAVRSQPCPAGTQKNTPGASPVCAPCAVGYYSASPSDTAPCSPCANGTYCPSVGGTAPLPCPVGGGAQCPSQCFIPSGYQTGAPLVKCAVGSYCSGNGVITNCPAGYFCPTGSSSPTACPPDSYCPEHGMGAPLPCLVGGTCPTACSIPGGYATASLSGGIACSPGAYCPPNNGSTICPVGFFCPPGAMTPSLCPIGYWGSFSGLSAPFCSGICPTGTYGIKPGGTSQAVACAPCPNGTTSAAGSTEASSCVTAAYICPSNYTLSGGILVAKSFSDCIPLVCAPPLTLAASLLGCIGQCGVGSIISQAGICTPCTSTSLICPGFNISFSLLAGGSGSGSGAGGGPLPFSSSSSSSYSAAGGSPSSSATMSNSICKSYYSMVAAAGGGTSSPSSSSSSSATAISPSVAALIVLAVVMGILMIILYSSSSLSALIEKSMASIDLFSLKQPQVVGGSPVLEPSALGGLCSALGITILITLALILILRRQEDNILSVSSLSVLDAASGALYTQTPLSTASGAGPAATSGLFLAVSSLTSLGGGCSLPLSNSIQASLGGGNWLPPQSIPDCGDGSSLLLFSCPACLFSAASALSFNLPYTCQALSLTVGAVNADGSVSTATLPQNATMSDGASILTSLQWSVAPVLSMLFDQVGGITKRGYQLITLSHSSTAVASSLLTISPSSSAVAIALQLPLQGFYTSTTLTPKQSVVQLLSSIIGLSGLLALFRVLHLYATRAREPLKRLVERGGSSSSSRGSSLLLTSKSPPVQHHGSGGKAVIVVSADDAATTAASPTSTSSAKHFNDNPLLHKERLQKRASFSVASIYPTGSSLDTHQFESIQEELTETLKQLADLRKDVAILKAAAEVGGRSTAVVGTPSERHASKPMATTTTAQDAW